MTRLLCCVCVLATATAARAQDAPSVSLRVFAEASAQRFSAAQSFEASLGGAVQPFFGGGLQATFAERYFVEVGASTFTKTGEQVFVNNGQVFPLGIPMTVTVTPLELAGGYRFHVRRVAWLVPYAEAGVGWYSYRQTSGFADPSENVDTRKTGAIVAGGAEFRLHRWVALAADVEYSHVPGVLGADPSVSHAFGETDLGGVAGRIRIVVGR